MNSFFGESGETWTPPSWDMGASRCEIGLTSPWFSRLLQIQAQVVKSCRTYFEHLGFDPLLAPVTTGAISSPIGLGSDSLPVRVKIGKRNCFLADSMQFYLEYALRVLNHGAYYVMPCFRGEGSDARHLAEFFHVEAELDGSMESAICVVEGMLKTICCDLVSGNTVKLLDHVKHVEKMATIAEPLPQIRWKDAIRLLSKHGLDSEVNFKSGSFSNRAERELIRLFGGSVWLTHPPVHSVPFYQARCPKNPDDALSADLLIGIGETVGLGERCHGAEELMESLEFHQVPPLDYEWYLTMKRLRPRVTAGFGMGLERLLCWVLEHDDVRDMQLFLRLNDQAIAL